MARAALHPIDDLEVIPLGWPVAATTGPRFEPAPRPSSLPAHRRIVVIAAVGLLVAAALPAAGAARRALARWDVRALERVWAEDGALARARQVALGELALAFSDADVTVARAGAAAVFAADGDRVDDAARALPRPRLPDAGIAGLRRLEAQALTAEAVDLRTGSVTVDRFHGQGGTDSFTTADGVVGLRAAVARRLDAELRRWRLQPLPPPAPPPVTVATGERQSLARYLDGDTTGLHLRALTAVGLTTIDVDASTATPDDLRPRLPADTLRLTHGFLARSGYLAYALNGSVYRLDLDDTGPPPAIGRGTGVLPSTRPDALWLVGGPRAEPGQPPQPVPYTEVDRGGQLLGPPVLLPPELSPLAFVPGGRVIVRIDDASGIPRVGTWDIATGTVTSPAVAPGRRYAGFVGTTGSRYWVLDSVDTPLHRPSGQLVEVDVASGAATDVGSPYPDVSGVPRATLSADGTVAAAVLTTEAHGATLAYIDLRHGIEAPVAIDQADAFELSEPRLAPDDRWAVWSTGSRAHPLLAVRRGGSAAVPVRYPSPDGLTLL